MSEREAMLLWITRYGDEINRVISRTADGPLRTSMMGEFCATATIRQAIARGDHLPDSKGQGDG